MLLYTLNLVPSSSETWFWGPCVGRFFRRRCRAGLTLETRRRYGWLRVIIVFPRCASLPSSNLVPFGRWWHVRGKGHCHGESGSALSGGYTPDLARAKGGSIVDEPGGC